MLEYSRIRQSECELSEVTLTFVKTLLEGCSFPQIFFNFFITEAFIYAINYLFTFYVKTSLRGHFILLYEFCN